MDKRVCKENASNSYIINCSPFLAVKDARVEIRVYRNWVNLPLLPVCCLEMCKAISSQIGIISDYFSKNNVGSNTKQLQLFLLLFISIFSGVLFKHRPVFSWILVGFLGWMHSSLFQHVENRLFIHYPVFLISLHIVIFLFLESLFCCQLTVRHVCLFIYI